MDLETILHVILHFHRRRDGALLFLILISLYHNLIPSPPFQVFTHHFFGLHFITTLKNANPGVWENLFYMYKECFDILCNWLAINTELPQYSKADITLYKKIIMFL